MDKLVKEKKVIRDKILSGLDLIAKPVVSTLSPKGNNVIIENDTGGHIMTNDGATIARYMQAHDQIENTIVEIIKEASLRTNAEAGDGTTTTVLLSDVLIKEALKLIDDGYSWIDVRNALNSFGEKILEQVDKQKIVVKNDDGLLNIAITSANNDKEIAKYVMEAITVAREEGMVFIEVSPKPNVTEVIKDIGFMVKAGVMYQELLSGGGRNAVVFKDTPVLITDKRLYYSEEAETVLRTAVKAGHKSVVIVAKDFMGEALNTLIANHTKGVIDVMLVKEPSITDKDNPQLYDLATYLGAKVFTDKTGSLVNKLTADDFTMVNQVYSDPNKTLFTPKMTPSKELKERIKMVREELEKHKDDDVLKSRLASMTTGVVTIKVGGNTPMEIREKIYRYEDAVNATRAAMKFGYLPGGGTALLRAFNPKDYPTEFVPMFRRYTEAIVRQIATNCGKHPETIIEAVKKLDAPGGYNALTDKYENLLKAGVVDPYQVIKMAVLNSISVTNIIISVNFYVINDFENHDEDETKAKTSYRVRS